MAGADVPATSSRLAWVDAARGSCVVAVVVFHLTAWHVLDLNLAHTADQVWTVVNSYLGSLRMPLLLAVSGVLASRRVRAGWRRGGVLLRAASSWYLYVVWLAVYTAYYLLLPAGPLPHRITSIGAGLTELVAPRTPLWYVFALGLYVVLLASVRRVPPWIVLTALTVLSVATGVADLSWGGAEKIPHLAVFFALGVYGAGWLRTFAEQLTWRSAGASALAAALLVAAGKLVHGEIGTATLFVARGTTFLLLGVAIVVLAIRWHPLGRLATSIGRQTLPIYVLHVPMVLAIVVLTGKTPPSWLESLVSHEVPALLYPVALTVLVVLSTLGLHRLLVRAGLGVLFGMPDTWRAALGRVQQRMGSAAAPGPDGQVR